jgi:hypothetical protein
MNKIPRKITLGVNATVKDGSITFASLKALCMANGMTAADYIAAREKNEEEHYNHYYERMTAAERKKIDANFTGEEGSRNTKAWFKVVSRIYYLDEMRKPVPITEDNSVEE